MPELENQVADTLRGKQSQESNHWLKMHSQIAQRPSAVQHTIMYEFLTKEIMTGSLIYLSDDVPIFIFDGNGSSKKYNSLNNAACKCSDCN